MAPPPNIERTVVVDSEVQHHMDLLREREQQRDTVRIFPFNPNFISDYKGYTLGMSAVEIDCLHAFRQEDLYVNSAQAFQRVTGVSDSLLNRIAPHFRFPERPMRLSAPQLPDEVHIQDLNKASADELRTIRGIGNKLSLRIVKFRESLGGFLVDEQLYDVYGLQPEVVRSALKRFKVIHRPVIKKININTASVPEIGQLVYISYRLARKIVAYREDVGSIRSFDELTKIEDFPSDKIDRIKLYLAL